MPFFDSAVLVEKDVTNIEPMSGLAIRGAGDKQDQIKVFTVADIRSKPLRFFTNEEIVAARAWLTD